LDFKSVGADFSIAAIAILARFVRITSAANQLLQVAELAVWASNGVNVAVGKSCASIPPLRFFGEDVCFQAFEEVDGGFRTFTSTSLGASIRVDLGADFAIERVEYYNRVDCCRDHIIGARVELLNANMVVIASYTITSNALVTPLIFGTTTTSTTTAPRPVGSLI
jgi:hypothetical protein